MKNDEVKDLVPELLSDITKSFDSKTKESKVLKEKLTKLKNKKANHLDSNEFAQEVGEILSSVFRENITEDKLPDGKIYYNIVNRVLNPNLKNNYNIINAYAKIVQDELNKKAKISLKAMDAEYNQDRVDGIVESVLKKDDYSSMINDLCSSTENFSRSIVDELIKNNANLHSKAGLKPVIERKMHGGACSFCKTLAGTYDYEEAKRLAETDPKKNPFARHRHCRCTVDYVPGNNKKQDIWSKKWTDIDKDDKIILRKELNKIPNSTLNRHTLKKLEEKNWTPSFKAKAIKFYRETSKAGIEFSDHGVSRAIDRAVNKKGYTIKDIIKIAKSKPIYIQTEDGRIVHSDGNIHLLKNPNTGDIVSVSDRKKPRKDWVKIDE